MPVKKLAKASKFFIVTLLLALSLLLFISYKGYHQVNQLKTAANLVSHTLKVENEINNLFSHYADIESTIYKSFLEQGRLNPKLLEAPKLKAKKSFNLLNQLTQDNPLQQKNLKQVRNHQKALYKYIDTLSTANDYKDKFTILAIHTSALEDLKTELLNEENELLMLRQKNYLSFGFFTPLMLLSLSIFFFIVFILSFWYFNRQRKATQRTNTFLEGILFNSADIISFFTPVYNAHHDIIDFTFKFTNKSIENVLGEPPEIFKNKRISEVLPVNFENGVFDEMALAAKEQEPREFKTLFTYKGKNTWLRTKVMPLKDGVLTSSIDVTLQEKNKVEQKKLTKRLEKQNLELLDNRAFLGNIFKSVSEIIINLECIRKNDGRIIDFKILFINDAITRLTGHIASEIIGKHLAALYPSIREKAVFSQLIACVKDEELIDFEDHYDIDGKLYYFKFTATKLNDGVTVTTREITQEKLRALELANLNLELEIQNSIFNEAETLAKVGSYHIETESGNFNCSNNFFNMLGYAPLDAEQTIDTYKTLIHPEDITSYALHIKDIFNGDSPEPFIYRAKTRKGQTKYLKTSGHFEAGLMKNVFIGVVQDVTEEIMAEQKLRYKNLDLEHSNAELESFNRVASHDLQEPMRKIQLFISRISDAEVETLSEHGQMYFGKIRTAANRMQNLIKYLLSYARLNKTENDFTQVDINTVIRTVIADYEESISEHDINLDIGKMPTVTGITFQLEQLFANLISNSIKYRREDVVSKIAISSERISRAKLDDSFVKKHNTYVRISFSDNGIGFDNAHAKKIFDMFERLHQRQNYSGTGIGLAICKKIVLNHNGHIKAEGKKGQGSTFYIYLPA